MTDDMKIDAEKVMKRCQIGTTNYEAANNLHAECYGTIGRLLAEVERLKNRPWVGLTKEEAKEISLANRPYVVDMIAALEARLKEKNK